jgi:hypothetical protein
MKENFKELKQQVGEMITGKYIPVIKDQINEQRKFLERLASHLVRLEELIKLSKNDNIILNEVIVINDRIKKLLNEHFIKKEEISFNELYANYHSTIEAFVSGSEDTVVEIQDEERFIPSKNDKLFIRLVKPVKKLLYNFSNIPVLAGNAFRRLLKKSIKEGKIWKRNVPVKKLRDYYFKYLLSNDLIEIQRKTYSQISKSQRRLKEIYESIDSKIELGIFEPQKTGEKNDSSVALNQIEDLQANIFEFENNLSSEVPLILEHIMNNYESSYSKAGTIEYPKYKVGKRAIKKVHKNQNKKFTTVQTGWQNNLLALNDSFKMNNEIHLIKYQTKLDLNSLVEDLRKKISEKIIPNSNNIYAFVNKIKDSIVDSNSESELLRRFDSIRTEITKNLTYELIPKISNLLIQENIGGLPFDFNERLKTQLNLISSKRILVEKEKYYKEIKDAEISLISPKEILEYSAAPKIFNFTSRLKSSLNSEIQKIQNVFGEIDHISDFTIDSAIKLLKVEHPNVEESKATAVEGLERALKQITNIDEKFEQLRETFNNELSNETNGFFAELKDITQTEKLLDVKLRLTKAKALEKSKHYKKKVKTKLKYFPPHAFWLIRKYFRKVKDFYHQLRGLIGLAPKAKIISSEVSDYLAETQAAMQALPFVYQRLFEIKPLEDKRFYFGRDLEMKELSKAFINWEEGKFSPTVIVGEKGSGSTTLINFFIENLSADFKVIRSSINFPCHETTEFLSTLGNLFGEKLFNSSEDIISYLNNESYKQVIILENLQRLFLRKVDGFKSLKILFEIISRTNKNIFWLSTSTLYCWMYLDKTIHAPDHLGYIVNLRKLNDNQITELVSKRHRVSGYNIEYEADEQTLKSKSFRNLSETEKQPYVMNKYFTSLNKFAQSNISLALLFWLRSAKEIIGDKIIIGSPPELDYSFLENLSNDKIFALSALLIHDGLREEDYSMIFNVPIKQARQLLLLLYDDGIVIKQNEMYIINPLLYRQIVGLLNAKNIIN